MNGVNNILASFEQEEINNNFLEIQMEQLQNMDIRDNCLNTLENMNVSDKRYAPEMSEAQEAMESLLLDLGMVTEAVDFAEECGGKNCGGSGSKSDDKELVEEDDFVGDDSKSDSSDSEKDKAIEAMLARIPEGSVSETTKFFRTTEGAFHMSPMMEEAVNSRLSLVDFVLG